MKHFSFLLRWVFAAAVALAAVAMPLAQTAAQAATLWHLGVGTASTDQAVQVNYFLPGQIWINVGDTVSWTWQAGEIHTVSFLSGQPPAFDPFGAFGGNTYDGTGQVSSGIRNQFFGGPYNLTFTAPGDFNFNCLVHPPMTGIVHVRPAGASLPHDQAYYDQQGAALGAKRLSQGSQFIQTALQSTKYAQDTAGIGEVQTVGSIAVLRFLPQNFTVKVNQTVTFTNLDPQTPHTVTFGPDGAIPEDQVPFPTGLDSTGHATIGSTSQVVSSGFLWSQPNGAPTFGTTFNVKFTSPGTYDFRCELHDTLGMFGTVTVTN